MAPKTTLNAKNLQTLGAQRLAELLIEISTGNAAHKRRLRFELASNHSSAEVAREVRKRLSSVARARTFIDWQKVKATKLDLETQHKMIIETVAKDDPKEAFELIWQFMALADPIFARSDDGSGTLIQIFRQACEDAGVLAKAASVGSDVLAEKVFKAVQVGIQGRNDVPFDWQLARVEALEALERDDEAQEFRWQCFEHSLNDEHLRAYVRRLPDFDDLEAEEKAFAYAQRFPDVNRALYFFLRWPSPAEAAKLIMARHNQLDGDYYELMTPAAEVLSEKHPLAATTVLRAMIDFTLKNARTSRYKHAARHLAECRSLARNIDDFGPFNSHEAYRENLRRDHHRKSGFWSLAE